MKAQRGKRGITQSFFNLGARRGQLVNTMLWLLYPWELYPIPIAQEAGLDPGPVLDRCGKFHPTGIQYPDRPASSKSLQQLHCTHRMIRIRGKQFTLL